MAPTKLHSLCASLLAWCTILGTARSQSVGLASTYTYSTFSYSQVTSNRYATPLPAPLTLTTTYAPAYSDASTLLPANITYTTWSLDREATSSSDGDFGQSAYASLWATLSYTNDMPFTTTASPTPVPTSELVFPPPLYNPYVDEVDLQLPSDFIWGVAGSSWQIEGGLQSEGRGPSILDGVGAIGIGSGANDSMIANMNYFLYKQDIARLAAIGIPHYSFSISWPRVVPFGAAGSPVNQQALDHYDDVINTCLEYGITPIVTLSHFDSPATVEFSGDETAFVDAFVYYAKIVAARYADRVPVWVTFNEPNLFIGTSVLGGTSFTYNSATSVLMAHATFYRWYKDELGGTGQVSLKLANLLAFPFHGPDNANDTAAAYRYQDLNVGIFANPLFLGTQYPDSVLSTPDLALTPLADEQISWINGTADFFAVDPYVAQLVIAAPSGLEACIADSSNSLWPYCSTVGYLQANGWLIGAASDAYSYVAPQYVRQQLGYLWNVYRPRGIMITEFGFPQFDESLRTLDVQRMDLDRSLYYQDYLAETLKAILLDGVNVIGALAWSFADNNELGSYASHYGIQSVNRTDGTLTRHYKRSIFDLVDFFHRHVASD